MKAVGGILIACALVIAAALIWHKADVIYADQPGTTTEFFRTYDPGPVIVKFGHQRERLVGEGGGSGWREATRRRDLTLMVDLPSSRVADLSAALRTDLQAKLQAGTHLLGCGEGSGECTCEYETSKAWGFLVLERIEPEPANQCGMATTWRIRMHLVERWHK